MMPNVAFSAEMKVELMREMDDEVVPKGVGAVILKARPHILDA